MKNIIFAVVLIALPTLAMAHPNVSFSIGFSNHGYVVPHVSVIETYHYHEHYDPYYDGPRYYDPHRKIWYGHHQSRPYYRHERHHRHHRECRDRHHRHRH